jgi:GntR family transcriptional repressor for pyruvate dehydrogenase complex
VSGALRPVVRKRLYEQVIDRLRVYAAEEGLQRGSRLPGERELAAALGVSRASVAQAIVALEVQGLVDTRHGGGIYLRQDTLEVEPNDDLVARKHLLPDVLDARDALESKLAALAAGRRTDADLAEIDTALSVMRQRVEAGEIPNEADRRFHAAIVRAAHSHLLETFYLEISDQIAQSRLESFRQPGRPRQSLDDHERIADAIRDQDEEAAARNMHLHVDHVSTVRLLAWDPGQ